MPNETISGAPTSTTATGSPANSSGQQPAGSAAPNPPPQQNADPAKQNAPPPTEAKGDQKAPEQQPDGQGEQAKAKPPEKYELKLPEGAKLDPKHLEAVTEYAKSLGMNQEQAQALVERDAALVSTYEKGVVEAHAKRVEEWHRQVVADKDLGGTNFDATREAARRALARFGNDSFKQMLNESGYGNHPEVVRVFAAIGRAMAEDRFVNANNPANAKKDAASILYGGG